MISLVTFLKGYHYFLNKQAMEIGIRILFSIFHKNIHVFSPLLFNYSQLILLSSSLRSMLNYQSRYFHFFCTYQKWRKSVYSDAQTLQNWVVSSPQRIETMCIFQGHQIPEVKGNILSPPLFSFTLSTPQTHRNIIKISLTQDCHWEVSYLPLTFNVSRNSKKTQQYLP